MKPVYATLSSKGYLIVGYIDDILSLAKKLHELELWLKQLLCLYHWDLQFTNQSVSQHHCQIPGIDFYDPSKSSHYEIQVPRAQSSALEGHIPIRDVASVVGLMVSAFGGVQNAPLLYRSLENDKTYALKNNGWDSEGKMTPFMVDHQC